MACFRDARIPETWQRLHLLNQRGFVFEDKVVLVTGGTGSFGKKFVEVVLRDYRPKKLIIFSRDELSSTRCVWEASITRASVISSAMCAMSTDCGGRSMASTMSFTP